MADALVETHSAQVTTRYGCEGCELSEQYVQGSVRAHEILVWLRGHVDSTDHSPWAVVHEQNIDIYETVRS
jgi:hypothetical protein